VAAHAVPLVLLLGALLVAGCGETVYPTGQGPSPTLPSSTAKVSPTSASLPASAAWIPAGRVARVANSLLGSLKPACQVQLEMYELGNQTLVGDLIGAHRRGCQVEVMLDGTESQSLASASELRAAGVAVKLAHIPGGIDHVKALALDGGRVVLIGGVNWGKSSSYTADADMLIPQDPTAAARLTADWENTTQDWSGGQVGPEAIEGPAISQAMLSVVASAKSKLLVITNYATSYVVQDALAADAGRGVTINVLLNPLGYGAKAAASWLSEHGIHVRWAPDSPYLHAKVILSSTEGLGGSANLSYHGLSINREMDAMVPASLLPAAWAWGEALWGKGTPVK
jgi:phosphatidylserine/phosphatidylglycerophosphate/cardiolipin synthase-like enzyme